MAEADAVRTAHRPEPVAETNPGAGYLTVRETAELLRMHFMSVYKLVQTGQLPAHKIGHRWKISAAELEAWIAKRAGGHRLLLVGASPRRTADLTAALGPADELHTVGYGDLTTALAESWDAVLIDSTRDANAALAALAICRRTEPMPFAVLLVAPTEERVLANALRQGLVTVLPVDEAAAGLRQLGATLQWN